MTINEFSKKSGLSPYTLRYYEKIGLLVNVGRNPNGHRNYSESDLAWVEFLKRLKETGMPLADMKRFARLRYEGEQTAAQRLGILEQHHNAIKARLDTLQAHQRKIEEKIAFYKNLLT